MVTSGGPGAFQGMEARRGAEGRAWPRRTMTLALAASAGLHAAAVLAAGWWLHPVVWHLKPVHVISVQVLGGRGVAGTPSPAQARPDSLMVPLRHKPTVAVRRSASAEERTPAPPRKIRIAQKSQAHRASPDRSDIAGFFSEMPRALPLAQIADLVDDPDFNRLLSEAMVVDLANAAGLGEDLHLFPDDAAGVAQGC